MCYARCHEDAMPGPARESVQISSVADTDPVIEDVRSLIGRNGVASLVVDDLRHDDLALLGWSGSPLHIESITRALTRVPSGEVEYLVVRAPDGAPIA